MSESFYETSELRIVLFGNTMTVSKTFILAFLQSSEAQNATELKDDVVIVFVSFSVSFKVDIFVL